MTRSKLIVRKFEELIRAAESDGGDWVISSARANLASALAGYIDDRVNELLDSRIQELRYTRF